MLTLLAMKGHDKKKHRDALQQGCLNIAPNNLKMQAVSTRWRTAAAGGAVWNDQEVPVTAAGEQDNQIVAMDTLEEPLLAIQDDPRAAEDKPRAAVHGPLQLKDLHCPACNGEQRIGGMRLRARTGSRSSNASRRPAVK